jgi:hypothetical protein
MSIEYIEKVEWQERLNGKTTVLIGAYAPALNQITMEVECRNCGRPIYVSPYERNTSTVLCLLCGLLHLNESDRKTIAECILNGQFD